MERLVVGAARLLIVLAIIVMVNIVHHFCKDFFTGMFITSILSAMTAILWGIAEAEYAERVEARERRDERWM